VTIALKSAPEFPTQRDAARMWWLIASAGIATGIVFRIVHLGSQSLWFDEGYTAWMVGHSPMEIIRLIRADTAPPLYYLLLHAWTRIFGQSESALRSLSALFSVLTLLLGLDIARKLLRNPAAIAAAAWALAFSYLQFWYAREARAYALMGFLGVALFDCLLCHLAAKSRRWVPSIAILIAAAMYTHNMMAPYVIALFIAWLVLPSSHSLHRRFAEIAAVLAIALALYLPWAIAGLPAQWRMIRTSFWVDPLKPGDFFSAMAGLAGTKQYWSAASILYRAHLHLEDGAAPASIGVILILASAIWSIVFNRQSRREALGLFLMACLPPLLVALYSIIATPLFTPKLFLPSATLLPIFVLFPFDNPPSRKTRWITWPATALLLLLCALSLYGEFTEDQKEDWRQIAQIVSSMPRERRLIVFVANDGQLPFDYYYRYRPDDAATGAPAGFFDLDPPHTMRRVLTDDDLNPLIARINQHSYQKIILVLAHVDWGDPAHRTQRYLDSRDRLAGETSVRDLSLRWYDTESP
jgi:mannosyltransferase